MNLLDAKSDWPDYTYDDLLDMVFGIMREKNPEFAAGKKKTFMMKPPQVARAGSKKTAFTNFAEICRLLKRQPKHVLQFLLAELGTTYGLIFKALLFMSLFSGSIDGNQCLIVKGRFQQKHFESVLRKYISKVFDQPLTCFKFAWKVGGLLEEFFKVYSTLDNLSGAFFKAIFS